MAGIVQIPWYVTVFRSDKFELAIQEIAPVALRYGASEYNVYRARDDRYRFLQMSTFEDKLDFERYWYSDEFNEWRADYASWYQVPVVYGWFDLVSGGHLGGEPRSVTGAPAEGGTGGI
jgi:hypothetical protein